MPFQHCRLSPLMLYVLYWILFGYVCLFAQDFTVFLKANCWVHIWLNIRSHTCIEPIAMNQDVFLYRLLMGRRKDRKVAAVRRRTRKRRTIYYVGAVRVASETVTCRPNCLPQWKNTRRLVVVLYGYLFTCMLLHAIHLQL